MFEPRSFEVNEAHESNIKLTYEPCMITSLDTRATYRGTMSCGHSIDPNNLLYYAYFQVKTNHESELRCPYVNPEDPTDRCNAVWTYPEFRKMAMLNNDEKDFFEEQLCVNKFNQLENRIRECQTCQNFVKQNDYSKKMICQNCLAMGKIPRIYCIGCLKEWNDDMKIDCINNVCTRELDMVPELKFDSKKKIGGVEVDGIQPCPNCGTLIEHTGPGYCRNVTCVCGWRFCFVCRMGGEKAKFRTCLGLEGGCKLKYDS